MAIPRVQSLTPTDVAMTRAIALTMHILTMPRRQTEAIAVAPGMGETIRVVHAIKRWEKDGGIDFLFVAGVNSPEKTFLPLTRENLSKPPYNLDSRARRVSTQVEAQNTLVQASWIVDCVVQNGVKSLSLTATSWHACRFYLTVLKQCLLRDVDILLVPEPAHVAFDNIVPEVEKPVWELVPGELARIVEYQAKGDVATADEFAAYLSRWKLV